MTYGYWLDRATHALESAYESVVLTRADGHGDAAATVAARNQTYRSLARLTGYLGGRPATTVTIRQAELLINSKARLATTSPPRLLGVGLRAAIAPVTAPAADVAPGELAGHLSAAGDALGIAGDILASHIGLPGGSPRTREGQAVVGGAGRKQAWAELARLSIAVVDIDRRLPSWLARGRGARTLRPVYEPVVERVRWWTSSYYPKVISGFAAAEGQSVLRLLDLVPATEGSVRPQPVTASPQVVEALDRVRAWLQRSPDKAQLADIVAACGLGVAVTTAAVRIDPSDRVLEQARQWGRIAETVSGLTGVRDDVPTPYAAELTAARGWLRDRLASVDPAEHLRDGLPAMLNRLPHLAHQLQVATTRAAERGHLYTKDVELGHAPVGGVFRAQARFDRATVNTSEVRSVLRRLDEAAAAVPSGGEQTISYLLGSPAALARQAYSRPADSRATGPNGGSSPEPFSQDQVSVRRPLR